jgi:hypothetical protein
MTLLRVVTNRGVTKDLGEPGGQAVDTKLSIKPRSPHLKLCWPSEPGAH